MENGFSQEKPKAIMELTKTYFVDAKTIAILSNLALEEILKVHCNYF